MARYTGPVCRLCRREREKLFLKGRRCFTDKCAVERRDSVPGQRAKRFRGKQSSYGLQLREKQKLRRTYGVLERQFRRYFDLASRSRGNTGTELLVILERRLDNVVYRLGLAQSRSHARQMVLHGHFRLNGHKADIPSLLVKAGDVLELREKPRKNVFVEEALEMAKDRGVPGWLELDAEAFRGTVKEMPLREQIQVPVKEQMVVELCSR